jgi:hypothetical protein
MVGKLLGRRPFENPYQNSAETFEGERTTPAIFAADGNPLRAPRYRCGTQVYAEATGTTTNGETLIGRGGLESFTMHRGGSE